MTTNQYMIADGNDNTAGLAGVSPQPSSDPIVPGRLTWSASRTRYADGMSHTNWIFTSVTPDEYEALLTAFGLSDSARSNAVTIRTKKNDGRTYANYNAIIHLPDEDRELKFRRPADLYEVEFLITDMEAL